MKNAAEIIEDIEVLPEKKEAEVLSFLEWMKRQEGVRIMNDATFAASAGHVIKKHDSLLRKLAA